MNGIRKTISIVGLLAFGVFSLIHIVTTRAAVVVAEPNEEVVARNLETKTLAMQGLIMLAALQKAHALEFVNLTTDTPWSVIVRDESISIFMHRTDANNMNTLHWNIYMILAKYDESILSVSSSQADTHFASLGANSVDLLRVKESGLPRFTSRESHELRWLAFSYVNAYRNIGAPAAIQAVGFNGSQWTVNGWAYMLPNKKSIASHMSAKLTIDDVRKTISVTKHEFSIP